MIGLVLLLISANPAEQPRGSDDRRPGGIVSVLAAVPEFVAGVARFVSALKKR